MKDPEDCAMRIRTFELIIYINNEGREQIDWEWSGAEVTAMAALGYLNAASIGMYHEQIHSPDD